MAPEDLAGRVAASFAGAADGRLREVATSLVRHLHAFLADVRLTGAEWAVAIDFLTRTGQRRSDDPRDRRQEFILLSDVLGASTAVIELNHPTGGTATESTVLGPVLRPRRAGVPARRGHLRRRAGLAVPPVRDGPRHRRRTGPRRGARGLAVR